MNTSSVPAGLLQQLAPHPATTSTTKPGQIDKAGFLNLFVAQLQNQDPLSPQDPSQLTAQLAQLTSVEQLTGINERLDKLTTATKDGIGASLLPLIGKDVRFDASQLAVEDGKASRVTYKLASSAANVTAVVRDSAGTEVRRVALGDLGVGNHAFAWDGKTQNGRLAPDGNYTVQIAATVSGQPVSLAVEAEGTVDGVDLSADPPVLLVNGARLTLDRVTQVRTPGATS